MDERGKLAHIPPQYHSLVELIGEEAMQKLCREYGGDALYIPKSDKIVSSERARRIIQEWNGYNTASLARKYKLTRRMVQILVQGKRPPEADGQVSMQEYL